MTDASSEAKQAGRGVIFIAFAKIYFIIAGAVIEFSLPSILSSVVFGAYKVVVSAVSPLNNVLITGTIQAVSRYTAQKPELSRAIQRSGFRMQLYVGVPIAVAFIALAPVFSRVLQDADKTGPMMLAGAIVLGYAFYAVFVGTANGRKEFHKQAGLDITMATMRAIGIVGLASAGFGVYGAIGGWVAATGVILVIASFVVGRPRRADAAQAPPLKPMTSFFVGVAVYLILLNLIMVVDTYLLKALSTGWFIRHQSEIHAALATYQPSWAVSIVEQVAPPALADSQVGYYAAVQNLARLSYQAIIAATFVIFPLVSRTTFADDRDATHRYIRTTNRYSLIFAAAIGTVLAANPQAILDIPYKADYAFYGAPALIALALGSVGFAIFAIAGTILNGAGLTRPAIILAAVTLGLAAVANAVAIPRFAPGRELLLACGAATGGAMVLGAGLGGYLLRRYLGAFVPLLSVVRVAVAAAAGIAIGHILQFASPVMTLVEAGVVGIVFLVVLVLTRELGRADLSAVTGLAGRSKGTAK